MDELNIAVIWDQDDVIRILVNDQQTWGAEGKQVVRGVADFIDQLGVFDRITVRHYNSEAEYLDRTSTTHHT